MSRLDAVEKKVQALLALGEDCETCQRRAATCPDCGRPIGYLPEEIAHIRERFADTMTAYASRAAKVAQ